MERAEDGEDAPGHLSRSTQMGFICEVFSKVLSLLRLVFLSRFHSLHNTDGRDLNENDANIYLIFQKKFLIRMESEQLSSHKI